MIRDIQDTLVNPLGPLIPHDFSTAELLRPASLVTLG